MGAGILHFVEGTIVVALSLGTSGLKYSTKDIRTFFVEVI